MKYISCLFLFFLLLPCFSQTDDKAFPSPPNPPRLVVDYAHILSTEEANALERKLETYSDTTSNQIAIVIMSTVPGGYTYSDYAEQLAEKWEIGQKDKNNGILIYVAVKEHKVFIATGYGMEATVTDAAARIIIEQYIVPAFKLGNYYEGLDHATTAVIQLAAGQFHPEKKDAGNKAIVIVLIAFIIIFFIVLSQLKRNNRYTHYTGRGVMGGGPFFLGGWGGGGFGGGGGSGGSDFGGFGGGDFGGGGAGGSW